MKWVFSIVLTLGTYLASDYWLNFKLPKWKTVTTEIIKKIPEAKLSTKKWQALRQQALDKLPHIYPFTIISDSLNEGLRISREFALIQHQKIDFNFEKKSIAINELTPVFASVKNITKSVDNVLTNISSLPNWLLSADQIEHKNQTYIKIQQIREKLAEFANFKQIFDEFCKDEKNVLILLQNNNEPRSSGGFAGSFAVINFSTEKISWNFLDVYALDRKIPVQNLEISPDFFRDLSPVISLRDANFWPDFPTTAQKYREFFGLAKIEKIPDTVVAINLNILADILKVTGPIYLDKWSIKLDEYNYDLALQFLVESKVAGRFSAKEPVFVLINAILQKIKSPAFNYQKFAEFDLNNLIKYKNILAHSLDNQLQELFEKWQITGELKIQNKADNFLYFDFISVRANKSEKFMKTKIWHNSEILTDGRVLNSLEIKRYHALNYYEIQDLLHLNSWPENIRDLLSESLLWKLGAGENRTILRVYTPKNSIKISATDPSGEIKKYWSGNKFCKNDVCQVFEIPMNVLPGETLKINLQYENKLTRGSHNWRPYFLEVVGTPGRKNTQFMATLKSQGEFSAETNNIGLPQALQNQEYRAVVNFKK